MDALLPDPGLDRQFNLLEILFERMPMGIAVLDCEYRILRYNPTWDEYSARYAPPSGALLAPGVGYFEHLPGSELTVLPLFERTLAGETIRQNEVRLESGGIVTYWDVVLAPVVENKEITGLLTVSIDATERVELRQNLEQRVEERTRQLNILLDVAETAGSSLKLNEMLTKTLDIMVALIGATRAGVILRDEVSGELLPLALRPERKVETGEMAKMLQACEGVIATRETLYIEPNPDQGLLEPGALLPIQVRDQTMGVLGIIGPQGSNFNSEQLTLFKSIADQLGVAIQNAYLFEKSEEAAIAAERNRLARDLHDAVTQTLFSASMIADVLPKIWDRSPEEGKRRLDELRQLTRGALSEMRTLLVELRPAAMEDTDLGDLLGHQVNAFIARTRLQVEFRRSCKDNPPPEVKEAFYRIAQEAFNNIAKHADASKIEVQLECVPGKATLEIQDNGTGFELGAASSDGLGLGIMRERASTVRAHFQISSWIGQGTRLNVFWQDPDDKE